MFTISLLPHDLESVLLNLDQEVPGFILSYLKNTVKQDQDDCSQ